MGHHCLITPLNAYSRNDGAAWLIARCVPRFLLILVVALSSLMASTSQQTACNLLQQSIAPLQSAVTEALGAHSHKTLYGVAWNADSLANLEVGKVKGRMVAFRFRAERSGLITGIRVFFVYRTVCYNGCYGSGNGGQVLLELQTDDRSISHYPSGKVLASSLIVDPMKQWNPLISFSPPVTLRNGDIYHVVFSNPAPDPVRNYVSIDNLRNSRRMPQMQPARDDLDLAVVWKYSSISPWQVNYGHTPIFSLQYADGWRGGQGYIDTRVSSPTRISGDMKAGEIFTLTTPHASASRVSVRVKADSQVGHLSLDLEGPNGKILRLGRLPASAIPSQYSWVHCDLSPAVPLEFRRTYRLVLSADQGGSLQVFPLQKGLAHQFDASNIFSDGHFQIANGSGWQDFQSRTDLDLQFYFTLD
jgi:hypothetical protein